MNMDTQAAEIANLVRQSLAALATADSVESPPTTALEDFAQTLQRMRLRHHLRARQELDQQWQRITQWVLGELSADEADALQRDIAADPQSQAFHEELATLQAHLAEVDRFKPLSAWRQLTEQWTSPLTTPMRQPAWGWRGGGAQPLPVDVPTRYPFQMRLFVGGFDLRHREVKGRLLPRAADALLPPNLVGAGVWLLPEAGGSFYEAEVTATGAFSLVAVPPGAYRLEMAWQGEFLEILDVLIPDL